MFYINRKEQIPLPGLENMQKIVCANTAVAG